MTDAACRPLSLALLLAVTAAASPQATPPPATTVDALRAYLLAAEGERDKQLPAASKALGTDFARAVRMLESLPPLTDAKPGTQHGVRFRSGDRDWEFSIRLPRGYDGRKRFPVLVLPDHGSVDAEDGIAFWEQSKQVDDWILFRPVIARHKEDKERFPDQQFFAVDQAVAAVMRDALRQLRLGYAVDHDRFVLTGLSQAGYYSWYFALTMPDEFAATVPESAGGPAVRAQMMLAPNLRHVAARILHAEGDQITPYADAALMHEKLKAAGASVELITYKDSDWTGAPPEKRHPGPHPLRLRNVLEWGAQQKRQPPDRIERVLRYRQQGHEARFRIAFTAEPTKPLTVKCSSAGGKLETDAKDVTYLVSPADVLQKRSFQVGGRKVAPKPDLEVLLRSLARHGDPQRLAAAEIDVPAK
jgi:predicted esterase